MGEFWDKGIQLVGGCTKVSPGCKNCWSERTHVRFHEKGAPCYRGTITDGKFNGSVTFNPHILMAAAKKKKPHVFAIWNDLYHPGITNNQIIESLEIMNTAKHHIFLIITKRPQRAYNIPNNYIWHIVTMETQKEAYNRMPWLLNVSSKRGIIVEPMLESIDLNKAVASYDNRTGIIHQVLCGPENGIGKRLFVPAWADKLKEQCDAAGVPFYRKDTQEGVLAWR
jgi:protein gp37